MENAVADKLKALYQLQRIDSKIDEIRTLRGELPMEVADLEDELEGLTTRLTKFNADLTTLKNQIAEQKAAGKGAEALRKKYEEQLLNIKNSREYEAVSKEVEFQGLEIQLAEKRVREFTAKVRLKEDEIRSTEAKIADQRKDLEQKRAELDEIIAETQKDEDRLQKLSETAAKIIDERHLKAYHRIRNNTRNGLAVVPVDRDSCGGCFSKIPAQLQLDIKGRKRITPCENCGRILVDNELAESVNESLNMTIQH